MPATLTPVSLRLEAEEYLASEETQKEGLEFVHGEGFALSGASRSHIDADVTLDTVYEGTSVR